MLPQTFITENHEDVPDFVCDKCTLKVRSGMVAEMVEMNIEEFEFMLRNQSPNVWKYKEFMIKQRKMFHENHANIVLVKTHLVTIKGHDKGFRHLSDELLNEKIDYCDQLVDELRIVTPGEFKIYPFDSRLSVLFYALVKHSIQGPLFCALGPLFSALVREEAIFAVCKRCANEGFACMCKEKFIFFRLRQNGQILRVQWEREMPIFIFFFEIFFSIAFFTKSAFL